MSSNSLKMKLQLRRDDLSTWVEKNPVLADGELALAKRADGTMEMRVGYNGKHWNELSSNNVVWGADQIEGLEDALSSLKTSHYEVGSLDELSGSYLNGDTAVVKKILAEGKDPSYTAYVYDGTLSAWKAMDGNYSSDNVYFEDNIVKAGSWTSIGNISHGANKVETFNSSGKSLTEVMDMIFKGNEAYPTKPTPSCGITQGSKSVEIGTTVTPTFTLSFDKKTYAYGSNTEPTNGSTTGVTAKTYTLTYVDNTGTTKTLTGNWTTSVTAGESYNAIAGYNNGNDKVAASLSVAYEAAAEGTYIPRSNLERVLSSETELTKYRVADGTATASNVNNKIIGYYPNFYGFRGGESGTMLDESTVDSAFIRSLTAQTSSPSSSTGKITPSSSLTASKSWVQCIYAIPTGLKSGLTAKDANNLPVGFKKMSKTVTVTHVNNVTSEYDVWYSQADSVVSPIGVSLTWS